VRTAFQEELRFELTLTLGGQAFSIPGGQVKHLAARLESHGFTASVSFWTSLEKQDAALFTAFLEPDLLQVRLSVAAVDPSLDSPPAPLVLQGLARSRRLVAETHGDVKGSPRVFRRYTIEFADPAQVLWRQHRPVELHTDLSLTELLDAHKASLQLSYDWALLRQKQPLLCLGLGADAPDVSFYDFVLWYVHTHQGFFSYDCQRDEYLLSDSRPSGQAAPLGPLRVQHVRVHLPPPIRHSTRVLNALANGPTTVPLEQEQAVAGVSQDILLRTPLTSQAEQRQKLEKTRLQVRQRHLQLSFKRFPSVDVFPGALLSLDGSLWPSALTGLGEEQRVLELDLEATAEREGPHDEQQALSANYSVLLSLRAEPASEQVPTLPPFRTPRYPIHVEGLVHSPGGEPEDRRYLIVEDEKTSLTHFRMTVPLWNQEHRKDRSPIGGSGAGGEER
jgi:hypothetical protein